MTAAERRVVRALLRRCDTALTDWVRQFAPEHCSEKSVRETARRMFVDNGGTLAYIAALRRDIKATLSRRGRKPRRRSRGR